MADVILEFNNQLGALASAKIKVSCFEGGRLLHTESLRLGARRAWLSSAWLPHTHYGAQVDIEIKTLELQALDCAMSREGSAAAQAALEQLKAQREAAVSGAEWRRALLDEAQFVRRQALQQYESLAGEERSRQAKWRSGRRPQVRDLMPRPCPCSVSAAQERALDKAVKREMGLKDEDMWEAVQVRRCHARSGRAHAHWTAGAGRSPLVSSSPLAAEGVPGPRSARAPRQPRAHADRDPRQAARGRPAGERGRAQPHRCALPPPHTAAQLATGSPTPRATRAHQRLPLCAQAGASAAPSPASCSRIRPRSTPPPPSRPPASHSSAGSPPTPPSPPPTPPPPRPKAPGPQQPTSRMAPQPRPPSSRDSRRSECTGSSWPPPLQPPTTTMTQQQQRRRRQIHGSQAPRRRRQRRGRRRARAPAAHCPARGRRCWRRRPSNGRRPPPRRCRRRPPRSPGWCRCWRERRARGCWGSCSGWRGTALWARCWTWSWKVRRRVAAVLVQFGRGGGDRRLALLPCERFAGRDLRALLPAAPTVLVPADVKPGSDPFQSALARTALGPSGPGPAPTSGANAAAPATPSAHGGLPPRPWEQGKKGRAGGEGSEQGPYTLQDKLQDMEEVRSLVASPHSAALGRGLARRTR